VLAALPGSAAHHRRVPARDVEHLTMDTDASGGAQRGFQGYSNNPSGTYTAVAVNPATGAQAQAGPVPARGPGGATPARGGPSPSGTGRACSSTPTRRPRSSAPYSPTPAPTGTRHRRRASRARGAPELARLQWTRPALPRRPKEFHTQLLRAQPSV
jgi:hypothetical protein